MVHQSINLLAHPYLKASFQQFSWNIVYMCTKTVADYS